MKWAWLCITSCLSPDSIWAAPPFLLLRMWNITVRLLTAGDLTLATRTTISLLESMLNLPRSSHFWWDWWYYILSARGLQKTRHRCLVHMNTARRASLTDRHAFRCPQCHTYTSFRSGSFFAKSQLPLRKWLLLMYLWVRVSHRRCSRRGWSGSRYNSLHL